MEHVPPPPPPVTKFTVSSTSGIDLALAAHNLRPVDKPPRNAKPSQGVSKEDIAAYTARVREMDLDAWVC